MAMQCSRYPRPEPPYSSSTVMPCRPSAPISGHRSRGKTLSRSIASARGAMRSCAKPLTVFRSMSTSGPSPKSKPAHALGIIRRLRSCARTGAVGDFISCSSRCQRLARRRSGHAVLPCLFQERVDRARRRGPGEEEALHLVAAGKPQQDALMLGFDALDEHRQAKRTAERHHRLDDHAAIGGAAERGHEALVDLDLVERKPLQVAEVGITGAEIVKCDTYAELVQILDALDHLVRVVDQHAFGNFQYQPVGR